MTLFEEILSGEIPSEKVYEGEAVFAIKDIAPQAPVHLLIIPKKPIPSIEELKEEEISIIGEMIRVAKELAKTFNIEKGYRLVFNSGADAGQTIFHLHMHLLGGAKLSDAMA
jgi:histidine triad (HIT) family protein